MDENPAAEGQRKDAPFVTTSPNAAQRVRIGRPLVFPTHKKVKVEVVTKLQGLLVLKPKHDVFDRYIIRAMNSVHELVAANPFLILLRRSRTEAAQEHHCILHVAISGRAHQPLWS